MYPLLCKAFLWRLTPPGRLQCPLEVGDTGSPFYTTRPLAGCRVSDAKEQIRQIVSATLSAIPQVHSAEPLLASLSRAISVNKTPKVKCAIMDYVAAGVSANNEQCCRLTLAPGLGLSALASAIVGLGTNKLPDIRRSALGAAEALCRAGESAAVIAAINMRPVADAGVMSNCLAAALVTGGPVAVEPVPRTMPPARQADCDLSAASSCTAPDASSESAPPVPADMATPSTSPSGRLAISSGSAATPIPPSPFEYRIGSLTPPPTAATMLLPEQPTLASMAAGGSSLAVATAASPTTPGSVEGTSLASAEAAVRLAALCAAAQPPAVSAELLQQLAAVAQAMPVASWAPGHPGSRPSGARRTPAAGGYGARGAGRGPAGTTRG